MEKDNLHEEAQKRLEELSILIGKIESQLKNASKDKIWCHFSGLLNGDVFGQTSQTGAQDDGDGGLGWHVGSEPRSRFLYLRVHNK